jgi:hypothetical protein
MELKRGRIFLHVDELTVSGVPPGDAAAVGSAMQRELTCLLSTAELPAGIARSRRVASLDAGPVRAPSGSADALGTQVAQAVHGSLRR